MSDRALAFLVGGLILAFGFVFLLGAVASASETVELPIQTIRGEPGSVGKWVDRQSSGV